VDVLVAGDQHKGECDNGEKGFRVEVWFHESEISMGAAHQGAIPAASQSALA
jgi:hypothetical protein